MNCPLADDRLLLVAGSNSFFLVAKAAERFSLCIETFEGEICETVEEGDLIVVSAPEGGPLEQARMLLALVRTFRMPLVVLPPDHPGSRRLSMVVSAGPHVEASCQISRGTHPEQHLICSSEELAGTRLCATPEGVELTGFPAGITLEYLPAT
ncbi:MAG: alpha/beta hydrolase [Methanomicrobiaceae archaeon]|nr:alpha/beta hydrolase [Methanomicrobiaceae archaeon]